MKKITLISLFIITINSYSQVDLKGINKNDYNYIEYNNIDNCEYFTFNCDYFTLQKSKDGMIWNDISRVYCNLLPFKYSYNDYESSNNEINYYRIESTYNEIKKYSKIIIINTFKHNSNSFAVVLDLLGRSVSDDYKGIVIYYYPNGQFQVLYKN